MHWVIKFIVIKNILNTIQVIWIYKWLYTG